MRIRKFNFSGIPSFVGVCIYTYEGVTTLLEIRSAMKKPEEMT